MSNLTKLAGLGDRSALVELLERIEQLEAQEGPGYGPCLEFYKRIVAKFEIREEQAFRDGWSMAYRNVGWGHTRFTQHEVNVGHNLWLGLDAHGKEIK